MIRPVVWLAASAVLLSGCAASFAPQPSPSQAVDLVAARRAAGIADCPSSAEHSPDDSTNTREAVSGGLPSIEVECIGGDTTVRLSELRGPLVLNLWAQWCEPCREEAPVLERFQTARPDIALLGLNYNDPQPDWAIEFAQLSGWTYPQLADPNKTTAAALGVPGLPLSILIDAEGRVVARYSGAFDSLAELEDWVDDGLAP